MTDPRDQDQPEGAEEELELDPETLKDLDVREEAHEIKGGYPQTSK